MKSCETFRLVERLKGLMNLKLMEVQMENLKKQSLIERYGKVNIIIAVMCVIFLVINSVIISETVMKSVIVD